jgi:hypothetical protein
VSGFFSNSGPIAVNTVQAARDAKTPQIGGVHGTVRHR